MAATATHAKELLLNKLMIKDAGEQYGLFVSIPSLGGESDFALFPHVEFN